MMNDLVVTALRALNRLPLAARKVASLSKAYLKIHENEQYDQDMNGERWLVRTLAASSALSLCFDVGANQGDWTELVLEVNPQATVHAFEISPPTYQKLLNRFSTNPRVVLNPLGLSNKAGDVEVMHCVNDSGLSSIIEVVSSSNVSRLSSTVRRGEDYCQEHQISRIDFLKVDVEGAENLVMEGFGQLLNPEFVGVIQFEYGMVNIASKFLLRDFHQLLEQRGFRLGKLFPGSVRFREYRFEDEDFRGPNFVAASVDLAKLLAPK